MEIAPSAAKLAVLSSFSHKARSNTQSSGMESYFEKGARLKDHYTTFRLHDKGARLKEKFTTLVESFINSYIRPIWWDQGRTCLDACSACQ